MPLTSTLPRAGREIVISAIFFLGTIGSILLPHTIWAQERSPSAKAPQSAEGARSEPVPDGLNYANGLFRDRRYDLAANEYERFLKDVAQGSHADSARFGLANARLFQGQYEKSRQQFEAFLADAPNHPQALTAQYRIGETSYMLGDLPKARRALEAFTKATKDHRNLETAWPYLGEVCLRQHDLPRAAEAYEQALQLYPKGRLVDRSRFGLGRTLLLQGKSEQAIQVLTELAEKGGDDWRDRAWLQIGQTEAEAKRYDRAIKAFETLEQVAPKSTMLVEARLGLAEALIGANRREEGDALLQELQKGSSPTQAAQAAFALGNSQLDAGHPEQSLETLDQAAERFAQSAMTPALLFRAAEAAHKLNRVDDARARFLKASEIDPKHPWADDAMLRAARLALEARDKEEAKSLAKTFFTRYPESPLRAEIRLIEAQVAYSEGQNKQAIELLSRSLEQDKPYPETALSALYYLGLAYRADGQGAKADEVLRSLAKTPAAPAAANAQYLVGQGHFEAKRYADAIPELEKYVEANPKGEMVANALTYLVWARMELGQLDEASTLLKDLSKRFPKFESLSSTRLRMGWALLENDQPLDAAAEFAALVEAKADDPLAPEAALGRAQALVAAKQPEEALKALAALTDSYPNTKQATQAGLAQARILTGLNRATEAAEAFQEYDASLATAEPSEPSSLPKGAEPDVVLAEWGWALLDAEKVADADKIFQRLLKEHPESPRADDARLILAQSAYDAKTFEEVVSLLSPLTADAAKTPARLLPSALFLMARALDKLDKLEEAAKLLDRLVNEFPEDRYRREARFLNADIALKRGDAEKAARGFTELAEEPPAETDPQRFGVAVRRGRIQCLVSLKRWDEVIKTAEEFKTFAPNDPLIAEVEYDRGRALQQTAQFPEALKAYQAVIDARKGGDLAARAQLMRGEVYFWDKNYQEALREYFRVTTLYDAPSWQAAALLEAGKVYEKLDQWAVAAETYEELCSRFPKESSAAEGKTRLEAARGHAQASSNTQTR